LGGQLHLENGIEGGRVAQKVAWVRRCCGKGDSRDADIVGRAIELPYPTELIRDIFSAPSIDLQLAEDRGGQRGK
jgi:hypothetical protein